MASPARPPTLRANTAASRPPGWSGSVTPTLGAYAFAPASRSYTSIATHQSAQDFATGIFQLSGAVTVNSQPLGGVSVSATNGTTCTATNASGQYTCTALAGWTGTITPALSGYTLTPSSRNYTNVLASAAAEDYSATGTGGARIFFIHADHLDTPRLVADATGTTVWRWDQQEPFGVNLADENPSALGTFELPLRLPGQYFDKETGLHNSYFRDCYDANTGRFCQADPAGAVMSQDLGLRSLGAIGLVQPQLGSLLYSETPRYNHVYAYARSNPLSRTDPTGLLDDERKRGGGGGSEFTCPLVFQFPIGFLPHGPGGLSMWYCVYDCNRVCPGSEDKMITNIQWDIFPHTGCLKLIPRPPGM